MDFLQYAYQANKTIGAKTLLGSAIRALGKGWKVLIVDDENAQWKQLAHFLQNSTLLQIASSHNWRKIIYQEKYDLVLSTQPIDHNDINAHTMVIDQQPEFAKYDLISQFHFSQNKPKGVIAITGTGKGKTTTALGYAVEKMIHGYRVALVQWFKEKAQGDLTWAINEHQFPKLLQQPDQFVFYPTGLGFFGSPNMDRVAGEEAYQQHRAKAYEGLELARKLISSGEYSCIVLDELIDTVKEIAQNIEYPLIDLSDVQKFLEWVIEQPIQVIVTGRRVSIDWEKYAKTTIVIDEIKHPWSTAKKGAVSGLDY